MPSRSLLSMYWNPNRPRTQSPPWPLAVSARSPHLFFQDNGDVMRWTSRPLVSRWIWQPSAQYAHVLAKVDCAQCHGDVTATPRVARVAPLTMGWCVDCHRAARAPDDCLTCHY